MNTEQKSENIFMYMTDIIENGWNCTVIARWDFFSV